MMLALTYGMMPSAKIDAFPKAPPENMLKKLSRPPPRFVTDSVMSRLMPGTEMNDADAVAPRACRW